MRRTAAALVCILACLILGCPNLKVTGVELDSTSLDIPIGGTAQLAATVTPAFAEDTFVTWSSSDEAVATVSAEGLVTGVSSGTATITVTTADGGLTATCAVTVHAYGTLDTGFGTGGIVRSAFSQATMAYGVALQADGKILVVGWTNTGANDDILLCRYGTSGALDASFGTGGIVTTDIAAGPDQGYKVVVQSDQKILVAGWATTGTGTDIALCRYTTSGVLDATFGSGGIVTTDFGASANETGTYVALQSDGKILVSACWAGGPALCRYNTDGSLDTGFDTDGWVTLDAGTEDGAYSVAVQSDGKIVLGGSAHAACFLVYRFSSDGSLDTSFNGTGYAAHNMWSIYDLGRAVAIDGSGKILLAGYCYSGGNHDFGLVRFTADGAFDVSGNAGLGPDDDAGQAIALQSDGKILVAGGGDNPTNTGADAGLVRFNADLSLDPTFGSGGKVFPEMGGGDDYFYSLAIQPTDGKIIVAGQSSGQLLLCRYHALDF